jgi:hypothetical protein
MTEEMKKHFLAGFDLAAQRRKDGKLYAYLGESVMDDWPDEVEMCGNVYTKEDVVKGNDGYESALYA